MSRLEIPGQLSCLYVFSIHILTIAPGCVLCSNNSYLAKGKPHCFQQNLPHSAFLGIALIFSYIFKISLNRCPEEHFQKATFGFMKMLSCSSHFSFPTTVYL